MNKYRKAMKKVFIVNLVFMVSLLGMVFSIISCNQQVNNQKNPGIFLTRLDGKQIQLNNLTSKWIVLNYWASWCKPCYQEIPVLNDFAKKYSDQVMVVGVSYDQVEPQQLLIIIKNMGIQFTTLKYDPALTLGIKNIPGLPATYVINSQGKIMNQLLGPQTLAKLQAAIHVN